MEQILRNFFNDNAVTVGLCDLARKIASLDTMVLQPQYVPQQKTSLAQIFAQQQQAYAMQQAYASKKQTYIQPQQVHVEPQIQQEYVESYIQRMPQQSQVRTVINGNMKKVVSAAVPSRR